MVAARSVVVLLFGRVSSGLRCHSVWACRGGEGETSDCLAIRGLETGDCRLPTTDYRVSCRRDADRPPFFERGSVKFQLLQRFQLLEFSGRLVLLLAGAGHEPESAVLVLQDRLQRDWQRLALAAREPCCPQRSPVRRAVFTCICARRALCSTHISLSSLFPTTVRSLPFLDPPSCYCPASRPTHALPRPQSTPSLSLSLSLPPLLGQSFC